MAAPLSSGNLTKKSTINVTKNIPNAGGVNSVAVYADLIAIAVEHTNKQANGFIAFYNFSDGEAEFIKSVPAGALPDNVVFSKNGQFVLSANEGEPSKDYKVDPEGSVTRVTIENNRPTTVKQIDFTAFNQGEKKSDALDRNVRISYPHASVAEDLEPEYIAISDDSKVAYVSLQENNAYAIIDIEKAEVTAIKSLGYKNHGVLNNGLDASNKDGGINIQTYNNVFGLYMPDTIHAYSVNGINYLVTANEGDSREYTFNTATKDECIDQGGLGFDDGECIAWVDEIRAGKLDLDTTVFDSGLSDNAQLGRLKVLSTQGDKNSDGKNEEIYSFGARSFSIFEADSGKLAYDSGDDFEKITAEKLGTQGFNANNEENKFDSRSDDKGPEPEALALGKINGQTYAFIGLERTGGIMIYNITNPQNPSFEGYTINRDFDIDIEEDLSMAGDLGPEGMTFVSPGESPTGEALLIVGNEISGTTTVYQVK